MDSARTQPLMEDFEGNFGFDELHVKSGCRGQ